MKLVLERFFSGDLAGWGVQLSRLGQLQSRFTIRASGRWEAKTKTLLLNEVYRFDDGHVDELEWRIQKLSARDYRGRETRIDDEAKGRSDAEAFTWRYTRRVPSKDGDETSLDFHDKFYLIDKDSLVAEASISRLFFVIATMSVFYQRT